LRVFENKVLRGTERGYKRRLKKLHEEQPHHSYSSPNNKRTIKSGTDGTNGAYTDEQCI
jgi:hypothetical protein